MWHMYLVSEKISQFFLFERTHRTPLSILMYIFNLKQKNAGHQEKNRLGKHWGLKHVQAQTPQGSYLHTDMFVSDWTTKSVQQILDLRKFKQNLQWDFLCSSGHIVKLVVYTAMPDENCIYLAYCNLKHWKHWELECFGFFL